MNDNELKETATIIALTAGAIVGAALFLQGFTHNRNVRKRVKNNAARDAAIAELKSWREQTGPKDAASYTKEWEDEYLARLNDIINNY